MVAITFRKTMKAKISKDIAPPARQRGTTCAAFRLCHFNPGFPG
jgi:hypothetical protein